MGWKKFSNKEVDTMRANPYTYAVTENRIMFTKEFKELFMRELEKGKTPKSILEEHGYDADVLGKKRIEGIHTVIRKQAASPEGLREGIRLPNITASVSPGVPELRKMQEKLGFLEQEIEFLKKISSIRNTGK